MRPRKYLSDEERRAAEAARHRARRAKLSPEARQKTTDYVRALRARMSTEQRRAHNAQRATVAREKRALIPKKPYVKRTGMPSKANEALVSFEYVRATYDHLPDGRFVRKIKQGRFEAGTEVGYLNKAGYSRTKIDGVEYPVARLIYLWHTGEFPPDGFDVGHLNLNSGDNRWENLALQTYKQNNSSRGTWGKYPAGVAKIGNAFRARCNLPNGKLLHLGYFPYSDFESLGYACVESEWAARGGEMESKGADYVPATRSKLVPNILGGRALMWGAIRVTQAIAEEAGIPLPTKDEKDDGAWDAGWVDGVDSVWDAVGREVPWPAEEDQDMSTNFGKASELGYIEPTTLLSDGQTESDNE